MLGLDGSLDDPRFATNADRVRNAEDLRTELESVLSQEDSAHWVGVLGTAGVACAPVQRLPGARDDQTTALAMVGTARRTRPPGPSPSSGYR